MGQSPPQISSEKGDADLISALPDVYADLTPAVAVGAGDEFAVLQNDVVVAGAGTVDVNGRYSVRGINLGKPFYNLIDAPSAYEFGIYWDGGQWNMFAGGDFYYSPEDVAFPWQVVTWLRDGTIDPVPAVTASPSLKSAAIDLLPVPTGIPATNIADGSVSNTKFQYLNSLTSNIQTQLDALAAAAKGAILACPVNNTVLATATGTVYTAPGNDGTPLTITAEGNVSFPLPRAGIIRNLFVRTGSTAKTNTPATVITIRKNGVDTTVTLTMTQTINTTTSDTAHNVSGAQGDLIAISLVTTGVAAISTSIAAISFQLD